MATGWMLRTTAGDSVFPQGVDGYLCAWTECCRRRVTIYCRVCEGCTWLADFHPLRPLSIVFFSVAMCRIFQQPRKPPEAVATLQKVTMLALHLFLILAGGLLLAPCRRYRVRLSARWVGYPRVSGPVPDFRGPQGTWPPRSPMFPPIATLLQPRRVARTPPSWAFGLRVCSQNVHPCLLDLNSS